MNYPEPFVGLQRIGLRPELLQHLPADLGDRRLLRVTEVQRDAVTLHDGDAEHPARLRPALRAALATDGDAIAVGDWVLAAPDDWGALWVDERLPPARQIARRLHDGRDKVARAVIASNVDTALLVMGLDPDFSLRRLERYLALVRLAGVDAVVVLTKADTCADVDGRLSAVQALLPPEVPAIALDARGDAAPALLAPWLQPGRTLVLVGSSGAGKSTLTNALTRRPLQATGGVRQGDGRGRHTTTARSLHLTPEGACIVDTPGLRTLRLDGEADALAASFDDVARLAPACRFRDCRHEHEPGCAVRDAVPAERLRNFHKLQREARRDTMSALERKEQVGQWKARARASRARGAERGD